jgi:hypothetical protein
MNRRGGSGKPRKRRRTDKAEARKALTARASVADLLKQLAQRTRERDEIINWLQPLKHVVSGSDESIVKAALFFFGCAPRASNIVQTTAQISPGSSGGVCAAA